MTTESTYHEELARAITEGIGPGRNQATERTDPHRPGAIIPSDYVGVLSYGLFREEDGPTVRFNVDLALECLRTKPFWQHPTRGASLFQCSVCGAHFNHGDIWLHVPTGEHIVLGHDCADKYGLGLDRSEWIAWHREQTALRAQATLKRLSFAAALRFLEGRADLAAALALGSEQAVSRPPLHAPCDGHMGSLSYYDAACPMCRALGPPAPLSYTEQRQQYRVAVLADMAEKLNRFGSLSGPQVEFALRLATEYHAAKAAPVEEEERRVPAPEGKVVVRGTVVSTKVHDGIWGSEIKMVVKVATPDGSYVVWSTVPAAILGDLNGRPLRGCEVEFSATLSRGKDAHFAFAKRPTKARLVTVPESPQDVVDRERAERYPVLTAENAQEAIAWQHARMAELTAERWGL